jgi:hypothetical protein
MRRTLVALSVLAVALAAVAAGGSAVGSPTPPAPAHDAGSPADVDAPALDDDVTVTIRPPQTVAKNVTHVYRVDVDGAGENATVAWTFEGTDETKTGREVEHRFATDGNKTVSVEVTGTDGATATDQVTVEVVDFTEDDAGSTPGRFLGGFAIIFVVLVVFPGVLKMWVLPAVMQAFSDDR